MSTRGIWGFRLNEQDYKECRKPKGAGRYAEGSLPENGYYPYALIANFGFSKFPNSLDEIYES